MGSFGLEYLLLSRISKSKWKTGTIGYPTYEELAGGFYSEAATHLPFVLPIHNLWRAKRLHELKYGTKDFKMRNHKEVEAILAEAGRCSHGESMYEAGPQSVTQVKLHNTNIGPHS